MSCCEKNQEKKCCLEAHKDKIPFVIGAVAALTLVGVAIGVLSCVKSGGCCKKLDDFEA
ncbi:MAG: hypothetical protein ACRCU3_05550 [Eubacteriaceae bacterium]